MSDLVRLAGQGQISNTEVVASYRHAWLNAPEPKPGEDRLAQFEDKFQRAQQHIENRAAADVQNGVFPQKDEDALRQGLSKINVAWSYNLRSGEFIYKRDSKLLENVDGSLELQLIMELARDMKYRRANGSEHPLRFPREQYEQFMLALMNSDARRRFDDFQLWLERELPEWDGTSRVDNLLHDMFGCDLRDSYVRWASRFPFYGAIQRCFSPGCKLDEMPVLIGEQGWGKSAFCSRLFPAERRRDWVLTNLDMLATVKERMELTIGTVVVEVAEMAGVGRDLQRQKSYLSAEWDKARLAYRRKAYPVDRRFIFIGTADRKEVLPNDPSGNRRFVPVELACGCDVDAFMDEHRMQLWAEALSVYRVIAATGDDRIANLPFDLLEGLRSRSDIYRNRDDAFEELLQEKLDQTQEYSSSQLYGILGLPMTPKQADARRLSRAMRALGWIRKKSRKRGGKPQWLWFYS